MKKAAAKRRACTAHTKDSFIAAASHRQRQDGQGVKERREAV